MKNKIIWIVRIIISLGILIYIFNIIPFKKVWLNISSANIWYILVALFMMQVNVYVAACKLKILTNKVKMSITVGNIFKINYITKFYDLFFPQVISGGVIRWYILSKTDKKPAETLASMMFNRLSDIQILVVLGLIFWIIDKPPESNKIMGVGLFILTVMLFSVYPIVLNKKLYDFLLDKLNHIKFIPKIFIDKLNKLLVSVGKFQKLSKTELVNVFGFTFAKHMIGLLGVYIFARSIDMNIGFISIGWIRTILQIICMLPISINGIGIREGSLIFMLGLYGISSTSAVAFSFLLYIVNIFGAVVGGAYLMINLLISNHEKKTITKGVSGTL